MARMTATDGTVLAGSEETRDTAAAGQPRSAAAPLARVDFGQRLTRLVEETRRPDGQRWTLTHVAEECTLRGVQTTRQYLAYLMTGQRDEPRLSLVEALADVFGVPAAYFTADYLGRVASELLPLLAVMHDPATRALVTRADLAEVAAALADPAVAAYLAARPLPQVLAALAQPGPQSAVEQVLADLLSDRQG
jgi:transcriptional regulator with XRE-family HTH domain